MPDQMKPRPREVPHLRRFPLKLLDVILAEFPQPQRIRLANDSRGENFRHRQQQNLRRVALCPFRRASYPLAHSFHALCQPLQALFPLLKSQLAREKRQDLTREVRRNLSVVIPLESFEVVRHMSIRQRLVHFAILL
jgi:hypothetical protein